MAAPKINSIVNNKDGTSANVTLDRVLGAGAAFFAARTPVLGGAVASFSLVSGTTYKITVDTSTVKARELWYITARDSQGDSAVEAVWVRLNTDDLDVNEAGKRLAQIILDNKKGIEAAMRAVYANATLKTIAYGGGWRNDHWMHVVINPASVDEEYWAAPFYRLDQLRFAVEGFIVHENETIEVPMITACARAIHMILGQQAYETITLSSGLVISGIHGDPTKLTIFDMFDPSLNRFVGGFSFEWKGEFGGGGQ